MFFSVNTHRQVALMGKSKKKGKRVRTQDDAQSNDGDSSKRSQAKESGAMEDGLQFEDPYEDVIEEDAVMQDNDTAMADDDDDEMGQKNVQQEVYRPGHHQLAEGEDLDYDSSAYTTFHKMTVDWPCLSFDIIRDSLGHFRTKFPATFYMVAGTQAAQEDQNKVNPLSF